MALKIADGNEKRSRDSAVLACLRQLKVISPHQFAAFEERFAGPIRNHRGAEVGRIVASFRLDQSPETG